MAKEFITGRGKAFFVADVSAVYGHYWHVLMHGLWHGRMSDSEDEYWAEDRWLPMAGWGCDWLMGL